MRMDKLSEFADAVTLTTTTGTNNHGSAIDSSVARDLGNGQPVYLNIHIATTVTSAGAATVAFQLVSDGTSSISTTTQTIHATTAAIGKASLVAGYRMTLMLPLEDPDYERYIGVQAIVGTAALTAGAADAYLSFDPGNWKAYAEGTN